MLPTSWKFLLNKMCQSVQIIFERANFSENQNLFLCVCENLRKSIKSSWEFGSITIYLKNQIFTESTSVRIYDDLMIINTVKLMSIAKFFSYTWEILCQLWDYNFITWIWSWYPLFHTLSNWNPGECFIHETFQHRCSRY